MSVEVALQEALDLLGPGLQTGHPAGLPVVDDRRPLVLTQRSELESVCSTISYRIPDLTGLSDLKLELGMI